jgi:hypothetical protein
MAWKVLDEFMFWDAVCNRARSVRMDLSLTVYKG